MKNLFLPLLFLFLTTGSWAVTVSEVDVSMRDSEKFMLRVDGRPFYPTAIQLRLDKLRGYLGWTDDALEAVVKRAADDGFNTVGIPVTWRDVEPEKDRFSWTVLDRYLGWCHKYGLRMELLWFSWSSGGRIQWLVKGPAGESPVLRTPDYVCSPRGTSDFRVLRKTDPWTLDWHDQRLRMRENFVLSRVMAHVAEWDRANGNPHTVIGVQLGNEALGHEQDVSADDVIDYYSYVGEAVKKSDYVVWTRMNCVSWMTRGRIEANERKREAVGTNVDFVGIDVYGTDASRIIGDIGGQLPALGKNFRMIMEIDAKDSRTPVYQIAALAGGKAFDYYNMAAVDGNDLYTAKGMKLVERPQITAVRNRNRILNKANEDVASKAQGRSLYVFNSRGDAKPLSEEKGLLGIVFRPSSSEAQAIAIRHSSTETVLLSTDSASFELPSSMKLKKATLGQFDSTGRWRSSGRLKVVGGVIDVPAASAVLIKTE